MTGIPITGTLVPDGSFSVVDVTHVHNAEVAGAAAAAVAAIPDATPSLRGLATAAQAKRVSLLVKTLEEFGAVGDCNPATGIGTDDTVAVQAALTWCDSQGKQVTGTPGKIYKVTAELNTHRTFILGSKGGDNSSWAFYRPTATGGNFLVIGGLEPAPTPGVPNPTYGYGSCWGSTIAGFAVLGPANCGVDCINVPYCFLQSTVDIIVNAGFTGCMFRCEREAPGQADWVDGYSARQGGYVIWCSITLDSLPSNDPWLGGSYGSPANGVSIKGYCLVTQFHGDFRISSGGTNYYFEQMGAAGSGSTAVITGSLENGLYGVRSPGGLSADVSRLHIEGVTHPVYSVGTASVHCGSVTAINPPHIAASTYQYTDLLLSVGGITPNWDATVRAPIVVGGMSDYIAPTSRNGIVLAPFFRSALGGTFNEGSYAHSDPPNQILCDFSRWVGADGTDQNIAGGTGTLYYSYIGTKCGVGCVDTTRTRGLPNCALLAHSSGQAFPVINFPMLNLHLKASDLGCFIYASFQAKTSDGSHVHDTVVAGIVPGDSLLGYGLCGIGPSFEFAGDDGFSVVVMSAPVTQDMVDHGAMLCVGGRGDVVDPSFYLAEPMATLGYACAREYNHCDTHYETGARLFDGRLEFPVDSIPVAATDPVFGQAFISGDRALLRAPTTTGSLMLTGWEYSGSAWVPQYVLTSTAILAAGYTDLLGTFDSSTATAGLTYETYRDTPLRMPWLHRSQDDAISLHYQMPHNWTKTAVEPHVRIIQGAAAGGDLVLDGRLAWSRSGVTNLPAWASWTPFRVKTTLSATQWTHTMISLGTFTPPAGALYPSASLHVWLRRPGSADAEDTYEGDKVGGPTAAANVGLEYADCHVQVQGFGTVTAT